jgi:glycosyltransferase involved in cell wall biosynthesis
LKIVLANKFMYPKGGDCLYTLRLMTLLKENGHTVIPFAMNHPLNLTAGYEKYFAPYIEFNEELKKRGLLNALKVSSRAVVNFRAAKLMKQLIKDHRPDIVHLQNIHHQLTPAIATAAASCGVPVVWTLHDYILNCPNDNFFRQGKVCTKCAKGNNIHAVINKCKKNSLGASLLAAFECTFYNPRRLAKHISRFICPSQFMANMLCRSGVVSEKVSVIPNFLPDAEIRSSGNDYFLYCGRLTPEKGVVTLLEAFEKFGHGELRIAGDGPQREYLQNRVKQSGNKNIHFLGHQTPHEIERLLAGCRAVIVPSVWYENLPYAVMETMAAEKPVIASRIGGIPEMVEHGTEGLLFIPGDVAELSLALSKIWNDDETATKMGAAGKRKVKALYSAEKHYRLLSQVYSEVAGSNSNEEYQQSAYNNKTLSDEIISNVKG